MFVRGFIRETEVFFTVWADDRQQLFPFAILKATWI